MSKWKTNPQSCAYLESLGINPYDVLEDGWNADGYYTYSKTAEGVTTFQEGEIPKTFVNWPAGFDYATLEALWEADLPTRRWYL